MVAGYIMSIYYIAIILSLMYAPEEESESREAVIPPGRRANQVSVESSIDEVMGEYLRHR